MILMDFEVTGTFFRAPQ